MTNEEVRSRNAELVNAIIADQTRINRERNAAPKLKAALLNVRSIIAEAAMTGFDYKNGDWTNRLFASQVVTSNALHAAGYQDD